MTKEDEELNVNYSSYRTTCGKYTDPDEPSAFQIDSSTLTSSVEKKRLYKYEYDVTPMYVDQIQYFSENEFLTIYGEWSRLSLHR